MTMKIKTNHPLAVAFSFLLGFIFTISLAADEVAQVSGAASLSVPAGSSSNPSYKVASIGISGDPLYEGAVASVSGNILTFETTTDSDGVTINPFVPSALAAGVAHLKAAIGGGSVTGLTDEGGSPISGTNTESSGLDNSTPPTITIDDPDSGDDAATATATVSGGKITGITITNAGSGYTTVPEVTVNCGPYLIRVTESGSDNEGRSFLVSSNTATTITVSNPNSDNLSNIFETDYTVEIIRATTLGEAFGTGTPLLGSGSSRAADLIYLWSSSSRIYVPYYHFAGSGRKPMGWYNQLNRAPTPLNDTVVWPDEGFIIARKATSALNLSSDSSVLSTDQKMQLPAAGEQFVMNNPFGTDILFTELLSPTNIGTGNDKFKPAVDASGDTGDNVFLLEGSAWAKYWYKSGVNVGITRVATASAKAPGGGTMSSSDVSLASGSVSNIQTCNAAGNVVYSEANASDYSKVTIGGTVPAAGFTITFHDIRGRRINEDGSMELDVDRNEVSAGNGLKVRHHNKSYKVVASGGGFVVIKKRRSFNFDSSSGTPTWSTGEGGAGYTGTAQVYFMGGNNGTTDENATGTATVSGGKVTGITVTAPGKGYTYAPQVIIGGGGWRKEGAADAPQDGEVIGADTGILLVRATGSGTLTYLAAKNPIK